MPTRREVIRDALLLGGLVACRHVAPQSTASERRIRLGVCDWSLGKRTDPASFALAAQLGLDGVQIDLGDDPSSFLSAERRRPFEQASREARVAVDGVALGVLNRVPYKSDPRTEAWVRDSVDVAAALGVGVILLAFFDRGDLKGDANGQAEVVRRLKRVAPHAEAAGVVLGIESWLSAPELRRLIDAVGSPNVRVYYDVANANEMGYDVYREIRTLGHELVREVHAKENGALLGQGQIDFVRIHEALDDIRFRGWVQIEGAVPNGMDRMDAYRANAAYLRRVMRG